MRDDIQRIDPSRSFVLSSMDGYGVVMNSGTSGVRPDGDAQASSGLQ
jgi:hypothetical protein